MAKVTSKLQVTIPKALRKKLGLKPGTVLDFKVDDGKLIGVKLQPQGPAEAIYGTLGKGRSTDQLVRELRDPD